MLGIGSFGGRCRAAECCAAMFSVCAQLIGGAKRARTMGSDLCFLDFKKAFASEAYLEIPGGVFLIIAHEPAH